MALKINRRNADSVSKSKDLDVWVSITSVKTNKYIGKLVFPSKTPDSIIEKMINSQPDTVSCTIIDGTNVTSDEDYGI